MEDKRGESAIQYSLPTPFCCKMILHNRPTPHACIVAAGKTKQLAIASELKMLATSSPGLLIFCSLWCLVLPLVAVPSLVTIQDRYKAAKLPDYKNAEDPHQYCLGQVDHAQHSWKLKNYRKRQFQVGQIRSAGTVFQSLVLLLMYGAVCVVCNIGAVAGLGIDFMTASEQFDQFGSDFFPVKRIVLLFAITFIVSLQLWTMRAFNTRSGGKVSNRNYWKKSGQRAGILPFTNCFCLHELLLIMSGDVELNPGPGKVSTPGHSGTETSAPQEIRPSENIAIETTVEFPAPTPTIPEDNNPAFTDLETPLGILHLETNTVESNTPHDNFAPVMPPIDPGDVVRTKPKPFNQPNRVHDDDDDSLDANDYTKENPVSGDTSLANVAAENLAAKNVVQYCKDEMTAIWSEQSGFKQSGLKEQKDREKVFSILRTANKHFRKNKRYPLCIRCGQEKATGGKKFVKISHVFPESMLKVYQAVHCGNQRPFICDVSKFTQKAGFSIEASEYGYPLQCSTCEDLGDAESYLKDVYLLLIAKNEDLKAKCVSKKVREKKRVIKNMWLPYALVNIMYRGIFVCGDIDKILDSYQEKFIKLWYNARGNGSTTDVLLYITPLYPFLTNDVHLMYILERLLRNPTPTELYTYNDAGEFLYTNFDCFHLVLPLCTKSEKYFSDYINVDMTENEIFLRRCQYKTRVIRNHFTYYYPADHSICFPPVLQDVCFDKIRTWVQKMSIKVEIDDPFEPFSLIPYVDLYKISWILADIHPEIEQEPHCSPLQEQREQIDCVYYSPYGKISTEANTYTKENFKKKKEEKLKVKKRYDYDELIDDAIKLSVLNKLYQVVSRYQQSSLELEKVKEELKELTSDSERFLKSYEELEKELKKEGRKIELLMSTNKRIEKAYDLLVDTEAGRKRLITKQDTNIRQLEEQNRQLREKNNDVTDKDARSQQIIKEQTEQIRLLTEDNKQLKEKLELLTVVIGDSN